MEENNIGHLSITANDGSTLYQKLHRVTCHFIIDVRIQTSCTEQKKKFPIEGFFSKYDQIRSDLVKFTDEIINGKLRFLFSAGASRIW